MNRFDPDEDTNANEENHLKTLNQKIEKRKKKRKLEDTKENEASSKGKESLNEPQKKRSKKNKKKKVDDSKTVEGFTILGDETDSRKKKVTRVLPYWLAHPDIVEVDLQSDQLLVGEMPGLSAAIVDKLSRQGIKHFFPVQRQIIPRLLDTSRRSFLRPCDICVSAPTGSGKTLAFVVPIVESLRSRMVPKIRAVVVLPTQDLAAQVYKVFNVYSEGSGLRVKLLSGHQSVASEELVRKGPAGWVQLVDILVATPGRLTHHLRATPSLDLSSLRYLVVDEADRMMENIAHNWLEVLEAAVYTRGRDRPGPLTVANMAKMGLPLQKLLFSATLSQDPEKLEKLNLFEPKLFRSVVNPKDIKGEKVSVVGGDDTSEATVPQEFSTPAELKEYRTACQPAVKPAVASHIIKKLNLASVLVFVKSNEAAHRLALLLSQLGHSAAELSSDMKEKRKKILNQLASGKISVLVCSDALARGIDLDTVDGVICYDAPPFVKTYIHRVGRTARAGKSGTAVTLLEPKQVKHFARMLKSCGKHEMEFLEVGDTDLEDGNEAYLAAVEAVKVLLENEKKLPSKEGKKSDKKSKK